MILGWIILNPIELFKLGTSLLGVATFTSNIIFWDAQGYFEESAELNQLFRTWSLAVEEQFYLFFPILLFFLWKYGKQNVFWAILFISLISLALSEWGWRNQSSANFYLIPTNKTDPTGGVQSPIHKLSTIMIPNWIGSIPKAVTTGKNIGVKISTAGVISIKIPTKRRSIFIIKRIIILLSLIPNSRSLRFCGMFS